MAELTTFTEAAALWGVHPNTVRRWADKGKLPPEAIEIWTSPEGRRWIRIEKSDVKEARRA